MYYIRPFIIVGIKYDKTYRFILCFVLSILIWVFSHRFYNDILCIKNTLVLDKLCYFH